MASSLALSLAVMTPAKLAVAAGKVTPVPVELLIGTAVGVTTPRVKFVKLKLFSLVLSAALMVPEELVVAALIERTGVAPVVSNNRGAEAISSTLLPPLPAPIAVLKSVAFKALTELSALILKNLTEEGLVNVTKFLPTVVLSLILLTGALKVPLKLKFPVVVTVPLKDKPATVPVPLTLVTVPVPPPVPAPIAVLKSVALRALTVLSALTLKNVILPGSASFTKFLPTVVLSFILVTGALNVPLKLKFPVVVTVPVRDKPATVPVPLTLVTVPVPPPPVPAPIAVLKSVALRALTVLSALTLKNVILPGSVSFTKFLPTTVLSLILVTGALNVPDSVRFPVDVTFPLNDKPATVPVPLTLVTADVK
jgi:hypothetical protein